ncbi:MAG: glycosyltransferase 61 family protein [Solirubrobacterales bacterium]
MKTCVEEVVWGGPLAPADRSVLAAFGDFPVETLSRLWPLLPGGRLEGLPVVLPMPQAPPPVSEWLRAFGARVVELPAEGAVRFTRMHVPEPAWRLGAWIAPELRDVYLHARAGMEVAAGPGDGVLWLSRSTLEADRVPQGEAAIESLLREHVTVVEPRRMTLAEQIAALEGSRAVVGVIGSAFHTLLMTERTPDCLYLCPPWDKGVFAAQHRLLGGEARFAQALESMVRLPRVRAKGPAFPDGYRLLIAEALSALSDTVLPDLRQDPKVARRAGSSDAAQRRRFAVPVPGSRNVMLSRGSLTVTAPRELWVVSGRRAVFERDGSVARDTLQTLAELPLERVNSMRAMPKSLSADLSVDKRDVVWGGSISPAYGHFLTESVSRLWPLLPGGGLEGLQVVLKTPPALTYVSEWLRAFGARVVELPAEGAVRFTRMHVPEPAWRLESWIAPEIRDIHLQARFGFDLPRAPSHDVLWLSRTGLGRAGTMGLYWSAASGRHARIPHDECLLEWLLDEHVTPVGLETMTLAEQIAALEGSRAVVGVIGSAFHTLLMTERTPDCLYLCPPWDKGVFAAQHRLLPGSATFAQGLDVAAWNRRARREGVEFPHGYRILVPEALRALGSSVMPALLESPRLAAFADPHRHWATAGGKGPGGRDLDSAVARVLLDPLSTKARMDLADVFESDGMLECALEQYTAVAQLDEDHREAALGVVRLAE